jgi:hypothetical protein
MDVNRLKEAYQQLEALDDRLAYKLRSRSSLISPTAEQLDTRLKDVASFALELKDIVREFMLAFAKPGTGGQR